MEQQENVKPGHGWITPIIEWLAWLGTLPSRPFFPARGDAQRHPPEDVRYHNGRAMRVDTYVAAWALIEVLALLGISHFRGARPNLCRTILVLIGIRTVGIPSAALNIVLMPSTFVLSRARMVVLVMVNYIELALCFAVFYSYYPYKIAGSGLGGSLDGLHLSVISQLTVGYGDLYPTGWLRPLVWCQGAFVLIILGVAVSRYVSAMDPIRDLSQKPR